MEAVRTDPTLKEKGVGARTQQSMSQELRNRSLIAAIKHATGRRSLPETECKLDLKGQRVLHKEKEICRINAAGELEWLTPHLAPTEAEKASSV